MIKIVIVDDQVLLRDSIKYILDSDRELDVVETTGNGEAAIELCKKHKPDIILMDIEMPKLDGISATKIIKENYPDTKVIILTTFENPDNILESFVSKADGYIVKDIKHEDLILSIKCVAKGMTVIHESVKHIMVDRFKGLMDYKKQYQNILSEKDLDIVRLIANGKSNKAIANILNYSEGTIKNSVSRILEKLHMADRMQIAIFAMENGII